MTVRRLGAARGCGWSWDWRRTLSTSKGVTASVLIRVPKQMDLSLLENESCCIWGLGGGCERAREREK